MLWAGRREPLWAGHQRLLWAGRRESLWVGHQELRRALGLPPAVGVLTRCWRRR